MNGKAEVTKESMPSSTHKIARKGNQSFLLSLGKALIAINGCF